jgi:hypothetical protein
MGGKPHVPFNEGEGVSLPTLPVSLQLWREIFLATAATFVRIDESKTKVGFFFNQWHCNGVCFDFQGQSLVIFSLDNMKRITLCNLSLEDQEF